MVALLRALTSPGLGCGCERAAGSSLQLGRQIRCIFAKIDAFVSISIENKSTQLGCTYFKRRYRAYKYGSWQTEYMHEAFETNNWYNDISTRDRSREGAEEAIDLSRRFQNPNKIVSALGTPPRPALWGGCECGLRQDAVPCSRRSAKIGHH